MKNQPTPLERLIAEQRRVRQSCRLQEQKINEDFGYIHRHSGTLFISGMVSLFFSDRKGNEEKGESEESNGFSMFNSIWKTYSPLLWEAALPILLRWGMDKITQLFKKRPKSQTTNG